MHDAKRHQRSVSVSLLDLKNAFGEINHQLIRSSLKFHHIPDTAIQLFNNIYKDSYVSIASASEHTNLIPVERGVLQGDPCSPLLFNICFNSLMLTINQPKYATLGYLWSTSTPNKAEQRSWLQFADDALIVASNDRNSQILLNVFSAWCKWADMLIRIDKCSCFGMRKENGLYSQYLPSVFIDGKAIPTIDLNDDFIYLGKRYNATMSKETAKTETIEKLKTLLGKITHLTLKPQTKLKILKIAIYPKLNFELKTYDFSKTWITEELDSIIKYHIRNWMQLPISTCIGEISRLPQNKCGLGLPSLAEVANTLRITARSCLRNSNNADIQQLWSETTKKNVASDRFLCLGQPLAMAKKEIKLEFINNALNHVKTLSLQGLSVNAAIDYLKPSRISAWAASVNLLSMTLFCFVRKGMLQQLPTFSNLYRWGKSANSMCPLCSMPQTNKHVLNNCSSTFALERYKVRHDAILIILCEWLHDVLPAASKLYADLSTNNILCSQMSDIFVNLRPDIAIITKNIIYVWELTICHETNLQKSKEYKQNKYATLSKDLTPSYSQHKLQIFTLEISSLGLPGDTSTFTKLITQKELPKSTLNKIINSVVSNSYTIYRNRNSAQ